MKTRVRYTRREFGAVMAAGAASLAVGNSPATDKPDIVWIYCDELRADALGCYGHPSLRLQTPHLDGLAQSGVRFTNNFCNSPVCVSSRCCLLTGLHPEHTGVYNNEGAWGNFRMPRTPLTFPKVFSEHGYATGNFGKLHVANGMHRPDNPENNVFQHHDGTGGGMNIWQHLGEKAVQMIRSPLGGMNGGIFPDDEPYPPNTVTENALRWMEDARTPYLARISILQPHTPVLPPAQFVERYEGQDPGLPEMSLETLSAFEQRVAKIHGLDRMQAEKLRAARLHYYAQVAWIDAQVGKILDFLKRTGRLERTVVIFGADHGNPLGDTGAFEKHTFTPSVQRVPLLISWPGTIKPNQVRDDLCDSLDISKTLFGLAGVSAPPQFKGRDLFADPPADAIYSTIGFGQVGSRLGPNTGRGDWSGGRGWPRRSCIRSGRFRLDKNMLIDGAAPVAEDQDIFLADVVADPREMKNLADQPEHQDVVRELCAELDKHAESSVEVPLESLKR